MVIKEIIHIMNQKNITTYSINGKKVPFVVLMNSYGDTECLEVEVHTVTKDLQQDDINYTFTTDNEITEGLIDLQLPNGSYYISIGLNFKTEKENNND